MHPVNESNAKIIMSMYFPGAIPNDRLMHEIIISKISIISISLSSRDIKNSRDCSE